uniref:Neur_chan_memb domain-containing protein n=1 Tax=Strongyloides papillosus TaxID=174720 RepID=A0A0N5BZ23_STREA
MKWRIEDTWKRHCYWGPEGCVDTITNLQLEWYWSVVEFGIKITREASYFTMTITIPTITAVLITLTSFWIASNKVALVLDIFSIIIQGLFGWNLMHSLPPGNGSVPRIVYLYGANLMLTLVAYIIHVFIEHIQHLNLDGFRLPSHIVKITKVLRKRKLFQVEGITFDPSTIINEKIEENDNLVNLEDPMTVENPTITTELDEVDSHGIICLENLSSESVNHPQDTPKSNDLYDKDPSSGSTKNEEEGEEKEKLKKEKSKKSHLNDQLFLIRRLMFFIFLVIYIIIIFICCQ